METTTLTKITAGIDIEVNGTQEKPREIRELQARLHVLEYFLYENFSEHGLALENNVCKKVNNDPKNSKHTFRRFSHDITYWE